MAPIAASPHEVGAQPGREPAAIGQPGHPGGAVGDHGDGRGQADAGPVAAVKAASISAAGT